MLGSVGTKGEREIAGFFGRRFCSCPAIRTSAPILTSADAWTNVAVSFWYFVGEPGTLVAGNSLMVEKELAFGIVCADADSPRVVGHTAAVGDEAGIDGGAG